MTLSNELNTLFMIIYKYSKKNLIANKKIYNVFDWTNALLNRFLITNWEIFKTIISNKDSRFMFEFWRILFTKLNTKLFIFTTYYFQIDKNFERTNQIVKIALRYFIIQHLNIFYIHALSFIQIQFNNFFNVVIELFFNEINYDFKIKNTFVDFNKIDTTITKNKTIQRFEYRQKTQNVINFVVAKFKIYYNVRYMFLLFNSKNYVYFRFNQNYQLSNKSNRKFSQQRCEFSKIIRRIRRLTYEFELFFAWRIHFVIFIIQFESIFVDENLYQRFRFHYSNFVKMKNDTKKYQFYEVKRFVVKKIKKYNKIMIIQYLMRWFDYESKYDKWKNINAFENNLNLMKQYELNYFKISIFNENETNAKQQNKEWNNYEVCRRNEINENIDFFFNLLTCCYEWTSNKMIEIVEFIQSQI